MITALLPVLGTLLALTPLDPTAAASPTDFGSEIQQLASEFNTAAGQLLAAINGAVIDLTRLAYITVLILGLFLYFTRLHRRLGRELITGGIVLAVLSEFVFPAIVRV